MVDSSEAEEHSDRRGSLWLLHLVPAVRGGRWIAAALALALTLPVFWAAGAFERLFVPGGAWATAFFFSAILAYITPVFHFVTERTEEAFDALTERLRMDSAELTAARAGIRGKSGVFVLRMASYAVIVWLAQSWLLTGSFGRMSESLTEGVLSFVMSSAPLAVWLFMITAIAAIVDNARLFRRLADRVEIELLDPESLTPFGYMAASSILVLVGAIASLPIMWLGGAPDPWTTIPGLVLLLGALVSIVMASLWPVHRVLRDARRAELRRVQARIDALADDARAWDAHALSALAPLLVYRREIASLREWPLDLGVLTRFGLYLFIVPMTWVGAALIEYVVGFFIEG